MGPGDASTGCRRLWAALSRAFHRYDGALPLANGLMAFGSLLSRLLQAVDPVYLLLFVSSAVFMLAHVIPETDPCDCAEGGV